MRRRILYIQYTNPGGYPPLEHSSQILANAGWQILFLGTHAFGAKALEFPEHPAVQILRLAHVPGGWRQKLHYVQYLLWALVWTLRWRPNWIYASDPLICLVVLLLSAVTKARVVYHEHDSPSPDSLKRSSGFMRFVMWCRFQLAQRADLIILPNEARLAIFRKTLNTRQPMLTVWNCPRLDEVTSRIPYNKNANLRVLYQGSIVPSRLPIQILDAMVMLPKSVELGVIGYTTIGHSDYVQQLQTRIIELGLTERVQIWDAMPRYQLLIECQKFDVGLAFVPMTTEDINLAEMIGASNKVFDYMASGLALLVSDLPTWRQMYVETGYGLTCEPHIANSIAQALQWFLAHPNEHCQMKQKARQQILDKWNYDLQFQPVMKILESTNVEN